MGEHFLTTRAVTGLEVREDSGAREHLVRNNMVFLLGAVVQPAIPALEGGVKAGGSGVEG